MVDIEANLRENRSGIPEGVVVVAAAKTRTVEEVAAAIRAGVAVVGHNYVQEAERMAAILGNQAQWHMLGHLQKNKAKKAVPVFDMIETVDSLALAELLEQRCALSGKAMPVLVEVNSGREPNKTGVMPEEAEALVRRLADLPHVRVQGLMTMGYLGTEAEAIRPCFRLTKGLFDRLADAAIPNVEMRCLSMGMSDSYLIAVQEGATMVRIGTKLFGPRRPETG
jgi:pyridoxal phosphate enzyme (YggS family)